MVVKEGRFLHRVRDVAINVRMRR